MIVRVRVYRFPFDERSPINVERYQNRQGLPNRTQRMKVNKPFRFVFGYRHRLEG
jgi:hypothetical protein